MIKDIFYPKEEKRVENEEKQMMFQRYVSKPANLRKLFVILFFAMLLFSNYCMNAVYLAIRSINTSVSLWDVLSPLNFFRINPDYFSLYVTFAILLMILDGWLILKIYHNFKSINVHQKGDDRFLTLDEIKKIYFEVSEREERYPGNGGFLISRYKDKLYLDTSAVNNLILGMTRSGKGEMILSVMIEACSRALDLPSMVFTDPKMEIARMSAELLKTRGYNVISLNFIDPSHTHCINPLSAIYRLYKNGYESDAELMLNTLANDICFANVNDMRNKYFYDNAAQLFSALALSIIIDSFEKEKKTGISQEDKVNIYNVLITYQILVSNAVKSAYHQTLWIDLYFENRPVMDKARLKYSSAMTASGEARGSIFSTFATQLSIFSYEAIAKMTCKSDFDFEDLAYAEKPIALFLEIPDYDHSKDAFVSIVLRQMYFLLSRQFALNSQRKKRIIRYNLDELGNLCKIPDLSTMVSDGLGKGLYFTLYIQSLSQLENIYGKEAQTILDNCGNLMYILSADEKTNKKISEEIGKRTILDMTRSGKKFGLDKSYTESYMQQPLLSDTKLRSIKEGENIVIPTIHRRDNNNEHIRTRTIYNSHESDTAFKFRYEYLADIMDPDQYLDLPDIVDIDLNDHIYTFKEIENKVLGKAQAEETIVCQLKQYTTIKWICKENQVPFNAQESIDAFKKRILNDINLDLKTRKTLISLIRENTINESA